MGTTLFALLVAIAGGCLMLGIAELAIKVIDILGIDLDSYIEKWLNN